MGFKDAVDYTVNGVKNSSTYVLQGSYNLGCTAVSKVNSVVKGSGGQGEGEQNRVEKLKEYLPDQEKIGRAITVVTHPATKELIKFFALPPGGAQAYNIMAAVLKNPPSTSSHTCLYENNKYKQVMEELMVLRDEKDRMQAEIEQIKNEIEYPKRLNSTSPARLRSSSTVEQKPEDVISLFMMKGFTVLDYRYDQVVPPIRGHTIRTERCDDDRGDI
ncbi:hypothetical protein MKX03_016403 [Papaver bracteatum]|nr:hypothetical protein MKX03_016403 [Papaver bracteatum]